MNKTRALAPFDAPSLIPAPLFAPTPKTERRVAEFFTGQVKNEPHPPGLSECNAPVLALVREPRHHQACRGAVGAVAAFVKKLRGEFAATTVKQHLAALRMLFDWLVTGNGTDTNSAHAVRGPKCVVNG